ncbi:MAG TPA: hypothetical protein VKT77_08285 [Chthonomonadaceae bacterium]|nr:hypothetical protein [Chthonomonadaceae bacterium]
MAALILVLFLVFAALMFTRRMPAMLALPALAIAVALIADHRHPVSAIALVFDTGVTRLAGAMSNAVFGAVLAQVVFTSNIAQTLVKKASELAGDRAVPVALCMMAVSAAAFLALSGLGAVIMVGTLVLPVLVGVGMRPLPAACTYIFGVSIGLQWNVAGWGFFHELLNVPVGAVATYATITGVPLIAAAIAYVCINARSRRSAWTAGGETAPAPPPAVSGWALLTPVLPVALLLGARFLDRLTWGRAPALDLNINAVLALAAVYGILTTAPRELVNRLTGAIVEGIKAVAPVLGLMIGIGMVIAALTSGPVKQAIAPELARMIPRTPWGYVLFFGLLSPLALYRGPLNLYGLGAAIAVILSAIYAPHLVMGALMATGLVQGVCDPTNTMLVWTAEFARTDVNQILRSTLPYVMAAAMASLLFIAAVHWRG